jgi:hypothetical protein
MRVIQHFALCIAAIVSPLVGAEKPDPAQIQAAMEQMSKTGAEHEALRKSVGDWDVAETCWMDPAAPPMTATHKATFTEALDGKWIRQDMVGEFMGQRYTGLGYMGYDTVAKEYVATWMDNISTAAMVMKGKSSDGGMTITYHSRMEKCVMTGGAMEMRGVFTRESDDKSVFQMFATPEGGKEAKMSEMVYTRAKKP